MQICGIVCEYNPFHNGHEYHIKETRGRGYDAIVCVMSGDFVQRGSPALLSKHYRAEMAIRGGADLVLELPTPWACSSAERFAQGAVGLLSSLGVVNALSFGCEAFSLYNLKTTADIISSDNFHNKVSEKMKSGISYAAARDLALTEISPDCAELLRTPNNILAVEYLRALPDGIKPISITRFGAGHDSNDISNGYASATFIRKLIEGNDFSALSSFMPESSLEILMRAKESGALPAKLDSRVALSHLKRVRRDDLLNVPDVTEGLESRIIRAIANSRTLDELISQVKTKRYAHSRIRRIILNAYLGITRDMCYGTPSYARPLSMNDVGKRVLALARKSAQIPIITKPASAKKLEIAKDFEREVLFSELYSLMLPQPQPDEWRRTPFCAPPSGISVSPAPQSAAHIL